MKHKIWNAVKKPKVFIPIIIILIAIIFFARGKSSADTTVMVHPDTFARQVSVAGKVIAAEDVNLGFEGSGKIAGVYAKVGDKVYQGQLIASIGNADLQANLLQRQAKLEAEVAKLSDLKNGKRPEEIAVSQGEVASAQASLDQAKQSMADTISDSYTTAENIIHNTIDQIMTNGRSDNPHLDLVLSDSSQKYAIESGRVKMESNLKLWQKLVADLSVTTDLNSATSDTQTYLTALNNYLFIISDAVNRLSGEESLKADISAARATLRTTISSETSSETSLKNATTALVTAQNKLKLDQSGTVQADIDAQGAQVKAAQADVDSAKAQIGKTIIVAPFGGVVTTMDLHVGEIVSGGSSGVSLISSARFEIESFVPEVNIAALKLNNKAKITLDAYGESASFDAVLTEINPAETIKDGVSTYKIKLQFTADDGRIRPGMTANIIISTDSREGVIAVSPKALIKKDGKTFVMIQNGKEATEQEVTTGAVSFDGMVEIVSGLKEGDTILIKAVK